MSDRKPLPGKFVWFEHVSRDAGKAQAFYSGVLGWKARPFPDGSPYEMIFTGDTDDTMIGGYDAPTHDRQRSHWISYVSVEDVDVAARAATQNGGRVVEAPFDLPGDASTPKTLPVAPTWHFAAMARLPVPRTPGTLLVFLSSILLTRPPKTGSIEIVMPRSIGDGPADRRARQDPVVHVLPLHRQRREMPIGRARNTGAVCIRRLMTRRAGERRDASARVSSHDV